MPKFKVLEQAFITFLECTTGDIIYYNILMENIS